MHTGRTVLAERSAMRDLSFLKRAEYRPVKIPGLDETNDDRVERVRAVIRENLRLTFREVANEVGISVGSCHQTFTKKIQMRGVSVKFVPRFLTDDQKLNHV